MPTQKYRTRDGKRVKGVTTIENVLAKPALTFWGYSQGLENYNKVTEQIVNALHLPGCSLLEIEEIIKNFPIGGLYDKRDKAATAGSLAHLYVEMHLKNLPEPPTEGVPEDIVKKAEGCYLAFLEWERSHKFKMVHSELSLVSERGFGEHSTSGLYWERWVSLI